jgi:hypothetical protein
VVSLTAADTSSPVLGDGSAEDADNTAIHASFPQSTLNVGQKLVLSGSVTMSMTGGALPPNASGVANNFRLGIFDSNGSATISGWLGYYMSAPDGATASGIRRRSSNAYYSQTGTVLLGAVSLADTTKRITDGTFDFTFSYERTPTGLTLSGTLSNADGYALVPWSISDTNNYAFDRVGFLAGDAFNAEQFAFSNVDVSVVPVPEPGTAALVFVGAAGIALLRRRD